MFFVQLLCTSPNEKRKKLLLIEHISGTIHFLQSKNPGIGIICGGDRNKLDINEILLSNCDFTQMNIWPTRKDEILDVVITNLYKYYNIPTITPPVQCDDPTTGRPSDHSPVLCVPNRDPTLPPRRIYKEVTYRPLPLSSISCF